MSDVGCAEAGELAPELALDGLGGAERAEVIEHIERCTACRVLVAELAMTADALLLVLPEREPPPGFASRASAALDRARPRAHRRTWRRMFAVGLAAAVAASIGLGAVLVLRDSGARPARSASGRTGELRDATMVGAGGRRAGRVFLYRGSRPWVFVAVAYGALPAGSYQVAVTRADGHAERVGTVRIDERGEGEWGGRTAVGALHSVRILDPEGGVLCEARFDQPKAA